MNTGLFSLALGLYKTFGRDACKRFLTPPRSAVEHVCAKTGADVDQAIQERNEAVEQMLQFIESCVDKDFVDPDPQGE